ncbi:hypothetical protein MRX96_014225 [Rhipicephalus microplus]
MRTCFNHNWDSDSRSTIRRVFVATTRMRGVVNRDSALNPLPQHPSSHLQPNKRDRQSWLGAAHTITRALCTRPLSASCQPTPDVQDTLPWHLRQIL